MRITCSKRFFPAASRPAHWPPRLDRPVLRILVNHVSVLLTRDGEWNRLAGNTLQIHEEANIIVDTGPNDVDNASAFKLDANFLLVYPFEEVKELA